jgi:membrane-bound inhibitor of C-type lysozyme
MRAALVIAVLALAACQTPCPSTGGTSVQATYECEDGSDLGITFTNDDAMVVQEGYTTLTLPSRISSSGLRYAGGGADLRGRMNEVLWTRPGAAETTCARRE